MSTLNHSSGRDAWILAWALTLMVHVLALVGLRQLPSVIHPPPVRPSQQEPVELIFSRDAPTSAPAPIQQEQKLHYFSELPPDRKDVAPDKADYLSNVTSRARDQVPGGNSALPRLKGESDAPTVALQPDGAASPPPTSPAVPSPTQPSPPVTARTPAPTSPGATATPLVESRSFTKQFGSTPAYALPHPADPKQQSLENPGPTVGTPGHSDMAQPEMDNPDGNASLTGDVSLNTTQWNYAPWLQRFGRRLRERWFAPPAYYMGILKDGGWAMVEAEITPTGELVRLDLLEQQGHPSLIRSATSAIRAMDPMEPLPADFPEKTLVLRIRLIYPKIRPR